MHRLGTLTSGVWRALSRELASAAERLDGQVHDHLDEVRRRAQALDVDPDQVLAAGAAAAHLHEHRQTLEELLPTLEEDVGRLAAADVLLGFSIEDEVLTDEQDPDDNMDEAASGAEGSDDELDEPSSAGVRIRLFLWPAPLTPAQVMIAPDLVEQTMTDTNIALNVQVEAADALVDALATTCGLPAERALPALSALGLACWSAHQGDEHGDLDDDDDDVGADDADDE
jgi:hypothetical protein